MLYKVYPAAAAWRIREDWFLQQALKDERGDDDDNDLPVGVQTPRVAQTATRDVDEEDDPSPGNR